ncbi:hypothetical protein [Bacillus chungangensis]|uniref:Uncharacterized protein n=1 Tax=Bacillus chungangensis TaxID=587633 RepID=A0ABT9WVI2_9BACI|nr:hypothetical protein [Bacillus chungangensis]MDQ0177311.1 hypothetical protein [Bacillus chungangensis]
MIDRKTSLYLGSIFLLTSGLLFTIERLSSYIYWFAQITTGQYPTYHETFSFLDNLFVPLFLLIGISFFIYYFYSKNKPII